MFKLKLVVSFCYLSVISDICEPCLGGGYPVSLKQNRQISHIPKIDFRSKAKNIPKNTKNDNAISHIPVIQRTHPISLRIKWQISHIPIYPIPRLSCWWVLNLFCDKRYQITFKIQDDDIYKMLNFLIDNIFVQCGGHVLQHLICIKIRTVRPIHRLVSSLLQGRINRSCQDERTASGQVV